MRVVGDNTNNGGNINNGGLEKDRVRDCNVKPATSAAGEDL
ncbi:hypothetical protein [Mucilaginibacter ginkgonis]|nr:hypothetical protein [Mucilaginibacter ginkgonis]